MLDIVEKSNELEDTLNSVCKLLECERHEIPAKMYKLIKSVEYLEEFKKDLVKANG